MFIRKKFVNTQIKRNKANKKVLMRTLGIFQLQELAKNSYENFSNGKTIDKILQDHAVAKKHKKDIQILLLNEFLRRFNGNIDFLDKDSLKVLDRFINLSKINETLNLGYLYCIEVHDKIKIGKTTNITNRLGNYKTHNGIDAVILALNLLPFHNEEETKLIKELSAISITKEWFSCKNKETILNLF